MSDAGEWPSCFDILNESHQVRKGSRTFNFDLKQIKGMSQSRAIMLKAAIEIGARKWTAEHRHQDDKFASSKQAFAHFRTAISDLGVEEFRVLYLNRANKEINTKLIGLGGLTGTVADPKVIFKHALELGACSLICCHNHPSGNLKPSDQDIRLTQKLKAGAENLDMKLLDHLIITTGTDLYFSFADEGLL